MNIEPASDPTLGEAMSQLSQMEAAESSVPAAQTTPSQASATPGERAPEAISEVTPATPKPEPGSSPTTESSKPTTEQKPADDKSSKYAKNQERLQGSWKQLNEEKSAIAKERETIKAEREAFAKERQELEEARQKASQPRFKPEDYEQYAKNTEAEAETHEAQGNFEEADKLRNMAKAAQTKAKELKANPPPAPKTDEAKKAEFLALQKEWYGKASIDFPAIVKSDSPEAQALKALVKSEPAVLNDPKGMYYAARLVCAETAAGKVPTLEKEVAELRAKVKDFSEKLAIPGTGAAASILAEKTFSEKSEAEQESELRQMAEEIDRR